MIYSTDRILTTHAGSLPRPDDLREMVLAKARGEPVDQASARRGGCDRRSRRSSKRQVECGLDIVNDGELSKPNFTDYVSARIAGCENRPGTGFRRLSMTARDETKFAGYFAAHPRPRYSGGQTMPVCVDELRYVGQAELAARPRQFQGGTRRGDGGGSLSAGQHARARSSIGWGTNTTRATRRSCSRSPRRCARNTRRSSMPGSCLQIDDPDLPDGWACLPDITRRRSTANTRRCGSTRSTTRCATFRARRSGCMCAGAASTARITTTFR